MKLKFRNDYEEENGYVIIITLYLKDVAYKIPYLVIKSKCFKEVGVLKYKSIEFYYTLSKDNLYCAIQNDTIKCLCYQTRFQAFSVDNVKKMLKKYFILY